MSVGSLQDRSPLSRTCPSARRRAAGIRGSWYRPFVSAAILTVVGVVTVATAVSAAPAVAITEFPVPGGIADGPVVEGPGGTVWFTTASDAIATITSTGAVRHFATPDGGYSHALVAGPDGNMWFLEGGNLGRLTSSGRVTEFPIPAFDGFSPAPNAIVAAGGDLWFTANTSAGHSITPSFIGRATTAGTITEFATPTAASDPEAIAQVGGDLWFAEAGGIGRVTMATPVRITEFPVPGGIGSGPVVPGPGGAVWFSTGDNAVATISLAGVVRRFPNPDFTYVHALVAGSDGNMWFLDTNLGRVTPNGQFTEFPIPAFHGRGPSGNAIVAAGGDLWFTANTTSGRLLSDSFIGRVTTAGVITEFATPTPISDPEAIAQVGGDLWFGEANTSNIGRLRLP